MYLSEDHEPYLSLHWRFPWMISCPVHKLKIHFYFSKNKNPTVSHTLDFLYAMDNITLQAVTKGVVEIASGSLHSGVWLRNIKNFL